MRTKADYIRDLFAVYCNIYKIRFDQVDVYSRGGHWYGQLRKVISPNGYDTELLSEWLLTYKDGDKEAVFSAKKIRDYEFPEYPHTDKG